MILGQPETPESSPSSPASLPLPEVESYGPTTDAAGTTLIQIRFNRPMVPFGAKTRLSARQAGFTFDPPIAGQAYWAEPTRLVFEPAGELPRAHVYAVDFRRQIETVDGPVLDVDLSWEFGTWPPELDLWTEADDGTPAHHQVEVWISSDLELELAELRRHLRVSARDGDGADETPVEFALEAMRVNRWGRRVPRRQLFRIRPRTHWPLGAALMVEVDAELRSSAGPRPLGSTKVHTLEIMPGVEISRLEPVGRSYRDGSELGPVVVELSSPISAHELEHILVEPRPTQLDLVAIRPQLGPDDEPLDAHEAVLMWGSFESDIDYHVELDPALRDVWGQPPAATKTSGELRFVDPPVSLELAGATSFERQRGASLGIESRHVDSVRVRAAVLDEATHEAMVLEEAHHARTPQVQPWPEHLDTREQVIRLVHSGAHGWSAHALDLLDFTGGRPGAVLVEVGVESLLASARGRRSSTKPTRRKLVQITDIGASVIGSLTEGLVRVARLSDDAPIAGAQVELISDIDGRVELGSTDADGLVPLPRFTELPDAPLLRVRTGDGTLRTFDDTVLLSTITGWPRTKKRGPLRAGEHPLITLTSERALYRPGERVRIMGWAAIASPYRLSSVRPLTPKTRIALRIVDSLDQLVAEREVEIEAHGKFWAIFELAQDVALGRFEAYAELHDAVERTQFRVEDVVAPAFRVSASASPPELHHGEPTTITVDASYYFGAPVTIERARHQTSCVDVSYRPPGLDPSWWVDRGAYRVRPNPGLPEELEPGPDAAQGRLRYELEPSQRAWRTQRCSHSVAVADAAAEVGAETSVLVHPAFYLAARVPRSVSLGGDATVELGVVDFDGSALVADGYTVKLTREWREGSVTHQEALEPCSPAAGERARCEFHGLESGTYDVWAQATRGEHSRTFEGHFSIRESSVSPRRTSVEDLSVSTEGELRPGEPARFLVEAPWPRGRGLLVLDKGAVHRVEPFELERGRASVELEVDDAWVPEVTVHALAVDPGDASRRPRLRQAKHRAVVDAHGRALEVAVGLPREAQAGGTVPIEVVVHDAAGRPAPGHVSLWAVDEAVEALAPLALPDFIDVFAPALGGSATDVAFAASYGALGLPYVPRDDGYHPHVFAPDWTIQTFGLDGPGRTLPRLGIEERKQMRDMLDTRFANERADPSRPSLPPIDVRSRFSSAPIFIGDAQLDRAGVVHVDAELPDDLTTFRVTAVASAPLEFTAVEGRFGVGDARIRVTRPLVVQAALPSILRPGDEAELAVLVDNREGGAGELELEVALHDARGVLELRSAARVSATISARQQLRVPVRLAGVGAGQAEVEVRALLHPRTGAGVADGVRLPLRVEPERTLTDRVAVYGSVADDKLAILPMRLPDRVDPGHGGLSVSLSSSLLGGLQDAVVYLVDYPHGCVEQTASSLLPLVVLGHLGESYPLGVGDVSAGVAAGLERLRSLQQRGGFSYWPGSSQQSPYASAYVTWVLHRAALAGHAVEPMLGDATHYLETVVDAWAVVEEPEPRADIVAAIALAVLAERGVVPGPAVSDAVGLLYERRATLPTFAKIWLLLVLDGSSREQLLAELRDLVIEREATAQVTSTQRWTWYWDTNTRSSAMLLLALLRLDAQEPLVAKLARGLLDARRGGRWSNTQDNAWALMALADYAAIYEADEPSFDGHAWLGGVSVTAAHARGRSFDVAHDFTPMLELLELGESGTATTPGDQLILERTGEGRMYYRVGLEWTTRDESRPAAAEGIVVSRTLRSAAGIIGEVDSVASGDLLALELELELELPADHVAVEVPLPAGLEPINLELGEGAAARKLDGRRGWFVSHQELRRDRVVIYADHLEPGRHHTTVFVRASVAGDYLMPAAHAEMMYYPEVYGRTTARRLRVR